MKTDTYQKVKFSSKFGSTAGLIVRSEWLRRASVQEVSRLFPYSEAMKMARIHVSPEYPSFEQAFSHSFD